MGMAPQQTRLSVPNERAEMQAHEVRNQLTVIMEYLLVSLLLVVSAPVMALACLLVRLTSRGPVLYTQQRMGLGGRCFTIYKIRTMYHDSETSGPTWCVQGDRRITPVGRFLRWAHLDELPQLINILRGDMGLVGPRPERPEIVAKLERAVPEYRLRLLIRPGLTGLAQVLQGPDADLGTVRRKLDLDLHYLDHRSTWLDLKIILATFPHVLRVPPSIIARAFGFPTELIRPLDADEMIAPAPVNLQVSKAISEPCTG
jgi:lipopolysaccharide/colanic/teichoic acid biosynthesis glycosyltransferase